MNNCDESFQPQLLLFFQLNLLLLYIKMKHLVVLVEMISIES